MVLYFGNTLGEDEGSVEGAALGDELGDELSAFVGALVGVFVGAFVVFLMGDFVGASTCKIRAIVLQILILMTPMMIYKTTAAI
jgi:hypothetical protein